MRALRSPAMSERASVDSVRRKLSLKPRTPTSAATPIATDNTTNPNLPGADFRSRQAMAAARFQLSVRLLPRGSAGSAMAHLLGNRRAGFIRQRILDDLSVFEHDLAVGPAGHLRIVGDQHQRGALALVA